MFKHLSCSTALLLLYAANAPAAGMPYEGFDYPIGPLNGQSGGTGFIGPWIADPGVLVQPPGLFSPLGLPSTGLAIGGGFNSARQLGTALNFPEYWASFQLQANTGNDQVYLGFDVGPSPTPLISFGRILNTYFIRQGAGSAVEAGVASPIGFTDLLVARFRQLGGSTLVDLWVNPTDFTLPPLISVGVPTVPYTWANVQVQPGFLADEIHIGLLPSDVSAVPEPELLGLLAVAAICALCRRRLVA